MIDHFTAFAQQHRRLLSIGGALWFAFGCAVYAKFITLLAFPFLTDDVVLYSGAAYNAVW